MDENSPNPYAAPQAALSAGLGEDGAGDPLPWDPTDVLGAAWELFKLKTDLLVGAVMAAGVLVLLPVVPRYFIAGEGTLATALLFLSIAAQIGLTAFVQVGLLRVLIAVARGEAADLGLLLSGGRRFFPMLGTALLVWLATAAGAVLFIVPGVIISLGLANSLMFAADTSLGPMDCLAASWKSLDGSKANMLLYGLLAFAVMVLGLLACGVGLFVAAPVVLLGQAIVYTRTSGRMGQPVPATAV